MIRSPRSKLTRRTGLTLIELFVILAICAILLGLLLPATRSSREAARRMQCSNNLKLLGLAIANYESTFKHFPVAMGGTGGESPMTGNLNRLSGFASLLPYMELQSLWDEIQKDSAYGGVPFPAMGPAPWVEQYPPWMRSIPALHCPSSASEPSKLFGKNYAFCIGDMAQSVHQPTKLRGAFGCRKFTTASEITDGISSTISLGEIGTKSATSILGQYAIGQPSSLLADLNLCEQTRTANTLKYQSTTKLSQHGRGAFWADGAAGFGLFNTIFAPNHPSCVVGNSDEADGIYSATSYHAGGVQVARLDGSVQFISDSIDTGDSLAPTLTPEELRSETTIPSRYGIWGALGKASGREKVD